MRGLEIRGTAVASEDVEPPVPFMSREVIRITPTWVSSWGVDPDVPERQTRRSTPLLTWQAVTSIAPVLETSEIAG